MRPRAPLGLALPLAALLAAGPLRAQAPRFEPGPCHPGTPDSARCGTVQVPENRERPGGRMLALNVVILPARRAEPARLALAVFGGGPGQPATEMAQGGAEQFGSLRDGRDLLFVDQRGTGRSAPLQCALRDTANPQSYLGDLLPPGPVARCRDELARTADLTRYGYLELAHDVEAVRAALGYERLDLYGASYGTRAAQVFMRTYPRSVRSAVIAGVVPPGYHQPRGYARSMEAALAGVERDCRADPSCAAAFPGVVARAHEVAERLERAPGTAEVLDPETGARLRLTVDRATFVDLIRRMLYDAVSTSQIPHVIHRAHGGDYRPVARNALQDRRGYARNLWWGLLLTITCSEDVAFIDPQAEARESAGTLLRDWRYRQQAAACRGWPAYPVPANYHRPLPLDIPTLLISGELDPVTPPAGGEAAIAAGLRNSLHVVVPSAGHSWFGMPGGECVDSLVVRFYRQASVRGLDPSCVRQVRRPPWVLSEPEPITLDRAAVERFAGTYVSADPALEVRFEALDGALRARVEAFDFTVIASPLSPTEFHWEGFPPRFTFHFSEDGRTLVMPGPNQPEITLTRRP